MSVHSLAEQLGALDPRSAAAVADRLVAADERPARDLVQAIERRLTSRPLQRFERLWGLSASQAAAIFGVSRQAYAKWSVGGVPADRRVDVQLVDAVTQLLVDHVKVDRIAAVVRRPAERLGGRSLLELARTGSLAELHRHVESMFDIHRIQP